MASRRRRPSARNAGSTTRSPASKPSRTAGPVSNNSACRCVRTSTARPCPTSSTCTSASPAAGSSRSGHSSGNHNSTANDLPGVPRGSNSQNAPSKANTSAIASDSGTHHNATGVCPSQTKPGQVSSKHQPANRHAHTPAPGWSASSAVPSKASGTTTKVHHGIATRFANGPTNDACPNRLTVSGSRPTVATVCADKKPRRMARSSDGRHHTNQATPRS